MPKKYDDVVVAVQLGIPELLISIRVILVVVGEETDEDTGGTDTWYRGERELMEDEENLRMIVTVITKV